MSYPVFYVPAGDVLPVLFASYAGSTGASTTITGFAVTDIEIYKDGSTTQRASDAGYTLLDTDGIDFDGITGIQGLSIDTGDNTDAGFYTVGAWFTVVVSTITVDAQTVSFIACQFRIMAAESIAGKPKVDVDGWLGTACATPTTAGVPEVDATHFNGVAYATALAAEVDAVWDEVLTGAAHNVTNSAGRRIRQMQEAGSYAGYIWLDTVGGTAGTTAFENGTDTKPVSNIADANTLATALAISQFKVAAGSSITFAATQATQVFDGENWTIALGGQSITATHIRGASVSGICTGASIPEFHECHIGNVTVPATHFKECHLEGTVTLPAGNVHFEHCSGNGASVLEFGAGVLNTTVNMTDFSGDITINNLGASGTDVLSIKGHGRITLAASCVGGTLNWDGHFDITNNGSGITITGDDIYDNTVNIQSRLPAALVGGRMDASVGAMAANTITDAAIAADVTAVIADGVWNAATASYGTAGTYGALVETNLDAAVSAIKAKTDSLTFTVANVVDANIQRINDVAITGDGGVTPFNV